MQVGVDRRAGHVGGAQRPRLAELVIAGRLVPGPEHPGRGRRRLAAGDLGQTAEGIGGSGAGDEAEAEVGRLGLDAPGGWIRAAQAEVAGLVVPQQDPVAGGGEQPGDREVGGVIPRMPALRRDDQADQASIGRRVGTIRDVVLDLVAALIHRIGALAEAEIALTRAGIETHADGRHSGGRPGDRRRQVDHPLAVRLEPHLNPAGGVGGLELPDVGAPLHAARGDAGGVEPARRGAEAERPGRPRPQPAILAEDGVTRSIGDRQVPGIPLHGGVQLTRGDVRERR